MELLERQQRELELRAKPLRLIGETIDDLRRVHREKPQTPVRARLEHYLGGLVPDLTVELDERL